MPADAPINMRSTRLRWPAGPVVAWFALLGLSAVGILPWVHIRFPIVDLAEMVYEVRRVQLGYVPYLDTFTHHFLGYIIPLLVVGSVVPLTSLAVKAVTVCFNVATAMLVWRVLKEVSRPAVAWLGALLAVTLGWFWTWWGFGFNVQSCLTPLIAAVLLCVVRACLRGRVSSLCWAAFWSGCLVICDQRTVPYLVLPALPLLFVSSLRRWRVIGLSALALALAPGWALWYLWQAGALNEFVDQTLRFPLLYRNQGVPFALGPTLDAWLGTWLGGERIAVPLMLVGLVAALAFERRRPLQAVWLASVACACVYAMLGGRPYPYYFMVFGPIILVLLSLLPHYVQDRWPGLASVSFVALLVLGTFCGIRPLLLWAGTGSPFVPYNEDTTDAVVDYLLEHTTPDDGVLVWGYAPQIYVASDRFRTFRDAGLLSIAGGNFTSSDGAQQGLLPRMVREFDAYLTGRPPKVIAVYAMTKEPCPGKGEILYNLDYERNPALTRLRDLIASSYRSALVVDGVCDRAEVFVREQPDQP